MNLLLLLRNLQPPPPPPFPCLVRLLETPTSTSDSSESSELPSYGSKNYNHEHIQYVVVNIHTEQKDVFAAENLWMKEGRVFTEQQPCLPAGLCANGNVRLRVPHSGALLTHPWSTNDFHQQGRNC